MNGLTKPNGELQPWVYGVAAGVTVGVATVGTLIGAWMVKKRIKARDLKTNEQLQAAEAEGEIDSIKASTPRETQKEEK